MQKMVKKTNKQKAEDRKKKLSQNKQVITKGKFLNNKDYLNKINQKHRKLMRLAEENTNHEARVGAFLAAKEIEKEIAKVKKEIAKEKKSKIKK